MGAENLFYEWEVPEDYPNYSGFDDIAQIYQVYFSDKANGGCIIKAKYHGEWRIPFSNRPLIRHLVELIKK